MGVVPSATSERQDIAKLHYELASKPYQANRTLAVLSKFFNWAEKHGLRPDGSNPCRHIEKYRESRRERFLSEADDWHASETPCERQRSMIVQRLGQSLPSVCSYSRGHASVKSSRSSGTMSTRSVGFSCLRDSKTGRKAIRLNYPARQVLDSVPRLEGNPFVICGDRTGQHLVNLQKPWRRIRKAAKLDDVRIHDLRHSFASVAASDGQSLVIIGKMLGHSQPATTARYAHLADDPVQAASEVVGARIAAAIDGRIN